MNSETTRMIASLKAILVECAHYRQEIAAEERAVKKAIKALEAIDGDVEETEETEPQETETEPQAETEMRA